MADFTLNSLDGMQFSAPNIDNDLSPFHCAQEVKYSGFWFRDCARANINGLYGYDNDAGVHWRPWRGFESLKKTEMKVRPVP